MLTPTTELRSDIVTCLARSTAVATCCWCSWDKKGNTWPMMADILLTISVCKKMKNVKWSLVDRASKAKCDILIFISVQLHTTNKVETKGLFNEMHDLSFDNIIVFKCFHCWEFNVTSIYAFRIYPDIINLMFVLRDVFILI